MIYFIWYGQKFFGDENKMYQAKHNL